MVDKLGLKDLIARLDTRGWHVVGDEGDTSDAGTLKDALEIMGREDLNQVPVMANGHLAGILSRAHVLDYLRTRAEMKA